MTRRCLVLSASMGAGHDTVAAELARRLRARGHDVHLHDVLALLPPGTGPALRGFYRTAVRRAPVLYTAIYRVFLAAPPPRPDGARAVPHADTSPLAVSAERPLATLVERLRPDVVVSTFHLAAQITGRMRERGALRIPSAVYVTDFAVHRGWLHPGNDLYLCVSDGAAAAARTGAGRRTLAPGPVVPPAFHPAGQPFDAGVTAAPADPAGPLHPGTPAPAASPTDPGGPSHPRGPSRPAGAADPGDGGAPGRPTGPPDPDRPTVLLSAGAWGVGSALPRTAGALVRHGLRPVVLCGRDERLRRRTARVPGAVALGWTDDLPGLMASARLLVDNAAGQTAVQALAAGLPVVGYRPIPGHGADGVRHMAAEGITTAAADLPALLAAADLLVPDGPARDRQTALGRALFREDAAALVAALATPTAHDRADGGV
ncbi:MULTISPECIES: MGDG synthase family glycosyltransferase [Streptomyces]|uniref:Galactosyldiacylglycerol synthase n=2 Tax=Streptomyces TaxID=1883 RepID=A0A124EC99_9ACTN|nr:MULTISPECIES: galactosyldiacylglycerol synthase [Streptomyces]KUH36966.1 galactosyldiacylglycerol synthase [Streptomyces kanasensis]UUS34318.1 galactosyldiacylglycerol synthase [Streptomyces changanensis]